MYVVNIKDIDKNKLYKCKKSLGEWLIYKKSMSPFGRSDDDKYFYFARTKNLEKALKEIPFLLRV